MQRNPHQATNTEKSIFSLKFTCGEFFLSKNVQLTTNSSAVQIGAAAEKSARRVDVIRIVCAVAVFDCKLRWLLVAIIHKSSQVRVTRSDLLEVLRVPEAVKSQLKDRVCAGLHLGSWELLGLNICNL